MDEEEEIGLFYFVNCDCYQMVDKFWNVFDEKEEEYFQFYFIIGCFMQMLFSFVECMVYEFLVEELDGESDVFYIFIQEDSGCFCIQDFLFGCNICKSQ